MEDKFNYIEEANVTMSETFHEGVPAMLIASGLEKITHGTIGMDKIKKFMFYGRQNEELMAVCEAWRILNPESCHDIKFDKLVPGKSREDAIRIFHGIIGIITEAGELAEALGKAIQDETPLDLTNVSEEIGDGLWYDAAMLRVLGTTFDSVQRTNIAKLRARFPNKFTEFDANNRNLDAERAILEQKIDKNKEFGTLGQPASKPVVSIKDYAFIGPEGRQFLVGTALDHSRAPGGGESEVRTTTIVIYDKENGLVETKNTIYKLVGEPA